VLGIKETLTKLLTKGDYKDALWTNTSSSNFSSQTVALDLSAYDAVDIEFSNDTSDTHGAVVRTTVGGSGVCIMNGATASTMRGRYFATTSTGIAFNSGVSGGSSSTSVVIPRKIWGVKLGG